MADDIASNFAGLPLGLLVCTPIIEVAKGQAELCRVYLEYVQKLAYVDGDASKGEVNILKFTLNRPVTDGSGNMDKESVEVEAPLLSLVPVPAFTMDEATVAFSMEVKESVVDTSSSSKEVDATASYSFWGFHGSISGKVSTQSGHTRQSDQSAKYDITARAVQQPPAEGMAKLTSIFAATMEPIAAGSGK